MEGMMMADIPKEAGDETGGTVMALKATQKRVIAASVAVGYCYVFAAFVSLEANPLEWDELTRSTFAMFGGALALIAAAYPGWQDGW
jgi:hypothetical protein